MSIMSSTAIRTVSARAAVAVRVADAAVCAVRTSDVARSVASDRMDTRTGALGIIVKV